MTSPGQGAGPPAPPGDAARDPYVHGATITQVFAHQVSRQPDAVALLQGSVRVTYRELSTAADALASEFQAAGVAPGCFMVVRMPRSPAFVAVLLAILKAGAAYLAADPAWPQDYAQDMLNRAEAWMVTDGQGYSLAAPRGTVVVDPGRVFDRSEVPPPPQLTDGSAPCTVFQTSGSTGTPKLAVVAHRATVRAFVGVDYADFGPGRLIMQAAPVCWDGLTMELWSVLLNGGACLLLGDQVPVSGELMRAAAEDHGLDTVWLTSSLLNALVDDDLAAFTRIRQVMSGGERVSPDHVRRLCSAHPGIRFSSGYGPAETTVFATAHVLAEGDLDRYGEVPLGRPLPATTVHVVDSHGRLCPPGIVGEIHIGGDAVGLGYLGNPAQTRQRFVTGPGRGLCYRTGDLGIWHESGVLLFRGRVDRQVKIRGRRVEPEELEAFIGRVLPGVVAAATTLKDARGQLIGLVAHCGIAGREVTADDVEAACDHGLPPHLRPRRIVIYPELPRNGNGKINYAALGEASASPSPRTGRTRPPDGSPAEHIIRIASSLLAADADQADDLFDLGGDSLFAMRLVARLRREEGLILTVGQVHRERTAARLAKIAVRIPAGNGTRLTAPAAARALTPAEEDLWIHEEIFPGDPALLVLTAYQVAADIDLSALRAALVRTCAQHQVLGSVRIPEAGIVRLQPLPAAEIGRQLPVQEDHEPLAAAHGCVTFPDAWLAPFDLASELPLRMYRAGPPGQPGQIALVMHHVAMDGWSEHIFTADLGRAYDQLTGGPLIPAADLPVGLMPPVTPATRERAREYWRGLLDGLEPLPVPRAQPGGGRFAELRLPLTGAQTRALAALPADRRDLHAGALAWYADALRHTFSRVDFAIGSAYAARDLAGEEAVGYHVQMIPLRVTLQPGQTGSLAEIATGISGQWLSSLDQRSLSLREIAACAPGCRWPGHRPVFQAGFALQHNPPPGLTLGGRVHARLAVRPAAPPFELYLEVWPLPRTGGAQALLQWDTTSVPAGLAERLAQRLGATSAGMT